MNEGDIYIYIVRKSSKECENDSLQISKDLAPIK